MANPTTIQSDLSVGIGVASKVSETRIWDRLMRMAEIGSSGDGGVNRQALSEEDIEARKLLLKWVAERGYKVSMDPMANLFVRRCGTRGNGPAIFVGSHMDSQPRGGRFDGIYGVLAGLEALEALDDAGIETTHDVELVVWTNEEGGRFAPGAMGSTYFAGLKSKSEFLDITDENGIRVEDALNRTLAATPEAEARRPGEVPACYLEAHIEQGPVLEESEDVVGIVSGIQGVRWYNVEIVGRGGHAGTTPTRMRADPVLEAIAIIAELNRSLTDPADELRFTVGRFDVVPNSPNSIAKKVSFSIDLRHPDAEQLRSSAKQVRSVCANRPEKFSIRIEETMKQDPCTFDVGINCTIDRVCGQLSIPRRHLSSGAFHDALFVSELCPSAMIFVPCEKGISHDPAELAKSEHLAAGAKALAATLTLLALGQQ